MKLKFVVTDVSVNETAGKWFCKTNPRFKKKKRPFVFLVLSTFDTYEDLTGFITKFMHEIIHFHCSQRDLSIYLKREMEFPHTRSGVDLLTGWD